MAGMWTLLLPFALVGAPAAPVQDPAAPATPPVREVLALESAGCDALLVDPKDAGLRAALHLVRERLAELPAELDTDLAPETMVLPLRLLYGPVSLRVAIDSRAASSGGFPLLAQLEVPEADPAAAEALTIRTTDFLLNVAPGLQKSIDPLGLYRMDLGPAPVMYGAVESDFVLSVGAPRATAPIPAGDLPAGVAPAMRMRFDLGALFDALGPLVRGPGMALDGAMLFGADDLQIEWDLGVGEDRAYAVSRTRGYRAALEATTGVPVHMLSADALRAVPADAVWAAAGVTDFEGALDAMVERFQQMAPEDPFQGQDPIEALDGFINLNLRDDLAAHLGAGWGAYMSDTTGGGGMASLVAFVELTDPDGLRAGLERVEGLVDSLGAFQARGYVRAERRALGDHELWALSFPGLPVPVEATLAISGDRLFVGATPQATLAAVQHVAAGGPSLLDDPELARVLPELRGDELAISYVDTAALLRDGYGWATMVAAALSNGVRSPRDEARQPGLVLPPYAELARGVRPAVTVARLAGDDLLATAELDRSMLVNMVAGMGWLDRLPIVELVGLLGAAGAMEQAQSQGFGR